MGFSTDQKDWKHNAHLVFRNVCYKKKSCLFQPHLYFMCCCLTLALGFSVMTPFSCHFCAFFYWSLLLLCYIPAACDGSLAFSLHFSGFYLPRCSAGCLYCTWWYNWNQNSKGSSAGWSKSHVCSVAPSTAGGIGPGRQPTARFQSPQACGARLSEREQMVTWIVQQVSSTPAHCLACSTLPQQTLLIIDVLKWPHHHWFLPSGRIIKVITATLTYFLLDLGEEWIFWKTSWRLLYTYLSVCVCLALMEVI